MRLGFAAILLMSAVAVGCKQAEPPKCESPQGNPWRTTVRIKSGETINLQMDETPSGYLFMEDGDGNIQVSHYSGLKDQHFQNVVPVLNSVSINQTSTGACTATGNNDAVCSTGNNNIVTINGVTK